MKLLEYLGYRGSRALTNAEAAVIGVRLKKGWVKRYADCEVPQCLVDALSRRDLSSKGKGRNALKRAARKAKRKCDPQLHKNSPARENRKTYRERSEEFLKSRAWKELRYTVLKERGAVCECCGASAKTGAVIHVDHVKPRFKFPELALVKSNLQVLCEDCNVGKGAWDQTDWRGQLSDLDAQYQAIMQGA